MVARLESHDSAELRAVVDYITECNLVLEFVSTALTHNVEVLVLVNRGWLEFPSGQLHRDRTHEHGLSVDSINKLLVVIPI